MDRLSRLLVCLIALALCSCGPAAPRLLDQQVYVWQRLWRDGHTQALADSHADFSTLRVLALQAHPSAGWGQAQVDLSALARDARPTVAVLRIDGQLGTLSANAVAEQLDEIAKRWRAAGVNLMGLELDHDAATARLPAYAAFVAQIRTHLKSQTTLSITALPAWLSSPYLETLLGNVDRSVLQVHAVERPEHGLFNPEQAKEWLTAYAQRSPTPFYLALPAYSVAVTASGAIESEVALREGGARQELRADPEAAARLLTWLRNNAPAKLEGVVWFRLPLPGDHRAWPLITLKAVANQQPLNARLTLKRHEQSGYTALELANLGNVPTALPARIRFITRDCIGADALSPYRLERQNRHLDYIRQHPHELAAGATLPLGWARCAHLKQGDVDELP